MIKYLIRKWKRWQLWKEFNRTTEKFVGTHTEVTLSDRQWMAWVNNQIISNLDENLDLPTHIIEKEHVKADIDKYEQLKDKYNIFLEEGRAR